MDKEIFACPRCKQSLKKNQETLICINCNFTIKTDQEYFDFQNHENLNDSKLDEILQEVDSIGFESSVKKFSKKHPHENHYLIKTKFDQSLDPIFHCMDVNYSSCLIIGDRFGNSAEITSKIFDRVYSINNNKSSIIFQSKRFQTKNIKNVKLILTDYNEVTFQKETFDLILINQELVYDEFNYHKSDIKKSKLFTNIKKILSSNGCLCLVLENKFGLKISSGDQKHSKKPTIGRFSLNEYHKFLNEIGFNTITYWGYPSISRPYFSARINDKLALNWYFKNFTLFVKETKIQTKQKFIFKILKNLPNKLKQILMTKFPPFFIFCCYKNSSSNSIEQIILNEFNAKNCLMISRRIKILYIVFNQLSIPTKIIHVKRYGAKKESDMSFDSSIEHQFNFQNQIWADSWKNGRPLNPLNGNEVISAVKWLFDFQKNTQKALFTKEDVKNELELIETELKNDENLQYFDYQQWIDEYLNILKNHQIKKTSIHGDFWFANMLFDENSDQVNLIDWENFLEEGNPFHDLMTFIMRRMMLSNSNRIDAFEQNLTKNENFLKILKQIQIITESYFKFPIDFNILLRYQILRNTVKVVDKQSIAYTDYLKMLKILQTKKFSVIKTNAEEIISDDSD